MKTAISVPDPLFDRVERLLGDLGMSRSQFYATAAQQYLDHLESTALTSDIDQALRAVDADPTARAARDPESAELSRHAVHRLEMLTEGDEW